MVGISLTYPKGIIENMLVKVDEFFFLANLIVLGIEKDRDAPLILGHPFLAIGQTLMDVKNGDLTLRAIIKQLKFNLNQTMRLPDLETLHCMSIDSLIPNKDELIVDFMDRDFLEENMVRSVMTLDVINMDSYMHLELVETIMTLDDQAVEET